ncbi:MAG: hypothetical protein U0235_22465 [Polyangiaceae bacterium]
MSVRGPVTRLFAFGLTATAGLVFGCDPASAPPPAAPEPTLTAGPDFDGCSLERVLAPLADVAAPLNCRSAPADSLCDDACRDAVRACVIESRRAGRPFMVAWTNTMVDGVGTRRAVVGRAVPPPSDTPDAKPTIDVTWFELTWVTGFDVDRATMAKKRVRVVRRRCQDVADVVASCDPQLGAPAPRCASRALADDAGMFCEPVDGTTDEIACAD